MNERPRHPDRGIKEAKERSLGIWMDTKILADIRTKLDDLRAAVMSAHTDMHGVLSIDSGMLDRFYRALSVAEHDNREATANEDKRTGVSAK